jgi:DNA invertase Pin-like site-specific DNA recombinase
MSGLEELIAAHRKVERYEKRAAEARARRADLIRRVLAEGVGPTAIAKVIGVSEGAVRKAAKEQS